MHIFLFPLSKIRLYKVQVVYRLRVLHIENQQINFSGDFIG